MKKTTNSILKDILQSSFLLTSNIENCFMLSSKIKVLNIKTNLLYDNALQKMETDPSEINSQV